MIPSAATIVDTLLARCNENIDDPERYLNWLARRASAGDISNVSFGAAIGTYIYDDDAYDSGNVDVRDQIERDLAIIEANALAILRKMGLDVSDEGHNSDNERIASCRIHPVTNAVTKIDRLIKTVLTFDNSNEPARTSSGTLGRLHPEAAQMIMQNVSDLGQQLIDVDIGFFDVDRLKEWALANDVIIEGVDDPSPEHYLGQLKPEGVTDEENAQIIQRGFTFSNRRENGSLEWHISRGRHKLYLILAGWSPRLHPEGRPDTWSIVDYFPGGSQTYGPGHFQQVLAEYDADTAKFMARSKARRRKLPEAVDPDNFDPKHYIERTFNLDAMLKPLGYVWQGEVADAYTKAFRRMREGRRQEMVVAVSRRGNVSVDNGDTLYDITLYKGDGNTLKPWSYTWGRTAVELQSKVKELEELLNRDDFGQIPENLQEAVPVPPEDDPEAVLRVHQHGLFGPELKRLGFKQGQDKEEVSLFGEKIGRFWVKGYTAADGSQRGVYAYLIHVLSGGNEYRVNNFDAANKCWYKHDMASEINVHCDTTAQAAAALREIDAAMERSAKESLPLDQEHEMLQRVATHYSRWYWNAMYPPGYQPLDLNAQPNNRQ